MALADIVERVRVWLGSVPITQGFGCTGYGAEARLGSCTHFHTGVDFGFPVGTDVLSPARGRVTRVGLYDGYGNTVVVQGQNGFSVLLGHLSRIDVHEGQMVDYSTMLGKTGGTHGQPGAGVSSGPHLHLSVLDPNGYYVDLYNGLSPHGREWGTVITVLRNLFKWGSLPGSTLTPLTRPLAAYNPANGIPSYYQPSQINDTGRVPGPVGNPQPIPGGISGQGSDANPSQAVVGCPDWFSFSLGLTDVHVPNPFCQIGATFSRAFAYAESDVVPPMVILVSGLVLVMLGLRTISSDQGAPDAVQAVARVPGAVGRGTANVAGKGVELGVAAASGGTSEAVKLATKGSKLAAVRSGAIAGKARSRKP